MICPECGAELEIGDWPVCDDGTGRNGHFPPAGSVFQPIDPSEAAVVYHHPGTDKIRWPGRADVPIPERYRRQGYERREFRSLRELDQFSKARGVIHEKSHFNSNGRGMDD